MRIIAGAWRSRPLEAPAGAETRPTADRTRETLFSMLTSRLGSFEGLTVLDLFAGSGALALEALSRGAEQAFLVERAPAARKAIEANIRKLGANARLLGQLDERLLNRLVRHIARHAALLLEFVKIFTPFAGHGVGVGKVLFVQFLDKRCIPAKQVGMTLQGLHHDVWSTLC